MMNRINNFLWQKILCLVFFFLFFISGIVLGEQTQSVSSDSQTSIPCLSCHDSIDKDQYQRSVHADLSCADCHIDLEKENQHHLGGFNHKSVLCTDCHEEQQRLFDESIHQKEAELSCTDCHLEIHHLQKVANKNVAAVKNCIQCHDSELAHNGHGAAVLKGNNDSADCADCHGVHKVISAKSRRPFFNALCIKCHNDPAKMSRSNQRTDSVLTYWDTYHGKVQKLGYPEKTAGCMDCHGTHNTLPAKDIKSNVNEANLTGRCRVCHPEANDKFARYIAHPKMLDRKSNPVLFWTFVVMISIFGVTVCFFTLHTILWMLQCRNELACKRELRSKYADDKDIFLERFCFSDRLLHLLLMSSFSMLLITGMPLLFKNAFWAKPLLILLGGPVISGILHRVAACVQIGILVAVFYRIFSYFFRNRKEGSFFELLFSVDSVMFRKEDWIHLKEMFRWFLRKGPKPASDRFSYWEKSEILAFLWGTFVVGITGALLWFPEIFSLLFPGWIYNVAVIIHAVEAMLATFVIIISHYFVTHLLPHNFPMNTVIFTGCLKKHKLREERKTYFDRMDKKDGAKTLITNPPTLFSKVMAGVVGTFFVILGLTLFALILLTFIL